MTQLDDFISSALRAPVPALTYHVSRWLANLHPTKAMIEGDDPAFDLEEFVRHGLAQATVRTSIHPQTETTWRRPERPLRKRIQNAWLDILWQEHRLEVLLMTCSTGDCTTSRHWIVADDVAIADAFYSAVCRHATEVRAEVLVFQNGCWEKSGELYRSIKGASFENLILPGSLKESVLLDFRQFFATRDTYERFGVPWKRGVLFTGPPGNGKTHTVKALLNALGQPCLYVRSLAARYATPHECMRRVFARARKTTPCMLVLEDLDALVDDKNRSFFLNELDGFADNRGIVAVATTNHPERLDPAILDRPSRFDRRYAFALPGPAERAEYLARWSDRLEPPMRLSPRGIEAAVERTEAFSFAYLKELCLSAMMAWIGEARPGAMDAAALSQVDPLREQMSRSEPPLPKLESDED